MSKNKGWLGFDSRSGRLIAGDGNVSEHGFVMPGQTVAIIQRPQIPFRGERLFTHQKIASDFLIHSFRVGNHESTVAYGPIPADAFATRMDRLAEIDAIFQRDEVFQIEIKKSAFEILGTEWPLPTALPGTDITILIENISQEPTRFIAGMIGLTPGAY